MGSRKGGREKGRMGEAERDLSPNMALGKNLRRIWIPDLGWIEATEHFNMSCNVVMT